MLGSMLLLRVVIAVDQVLAFLVPAALPSHQIPWGTPIGLLP
jgi:hypothetical protein